MPGTAPAPPLPPLVELEHPVVVVLPPSVSPPPVPVGGGAGGLLPHADPATKAIVARKAQIDRGEKRITVASVAVRLLFGCRFRGGR